MKKLQGLSHAKDCGYTPLVAPVSVARIGVLLDPYDESRRFIS